MLLARRLPPAQLASALQMLLDPLQPDGTDQGEHDPYYLELRILADGDVDIRGLLDPETGQNLAAEIERRLQDARTAAAKIRRNTFDERQSEPAGSADTATPTDPADPADPVDRTDPADGTDPVDRTDPTAP